MGVVMGVAVEDHVAYYWLSWPFLQSPTPVSLADQLPRA